MTRISVLALITFLLSASPSRAQKAEEWLPITPQDWQVKDAPGNPGASAIQLYLSYYKDDNDKFISVYKRLKILRDPGKKYADVEIEIEPGNSLKSLAARTIHQDGSIADYQGKPFEKTVFKVRGVKRLVKSFTMPDAGVGSIIEYKYTVSMPIGWVKSISTWEIQSELFTVKADFGFRPYQGVLEVPTEWSSVSNIRYSQSAYAYLNQLDPRTPEKKKNHLMEFHVENVPAFNGEEYMPPADDYKPVVLFYYGGHEISSPDKYWDELAKDAAVWLEKFIGNFREIHELAAQITGAETDPEKKQRQLYARTQQIRNISFERQRSEQEMKKEKIKGATSVVDVLNRGYGSHLTIDCVFAALARASGFEARMLFVSDRRHRSFNKLVLSTEQIDSAAVEVNVNGRQWMLDPGTRFNPFGLMRWDNTAVTALKFGKTGADFVTTPAPAASPTRRTATMSLTPDGALKGEITLELKGEEALEHRLSALETDDAGRRKDVEDEMQALLPAGSIAKLKEATGWDSIDDPLVARFDVQIPNFASVAGKRLIVPALLFATFRKDMFVHEGRIYPIVFAYPFAETDEVAIKLPEGYSLEAPPYRRKAGLSYAGYEVSSSLEQNQLVTKRSLHVDGLSFPPEKYDELKNFFSVVQAGDGGQAVFRPQETASADKKD